MRAVVMPLRSCGYTVMLTSLRESFMGGEEREMARSRREKRQQTKVSIRRISRPFCFIFLQTNKSLPALYNNALLCQTSPHKKKQVKAQAL